MCLRVLLSGKSRLYNDTLFLLSNHSNIISMTYAWLLPTRYTKNGLHWMDAVSWMTVLSCVTVSSSVFCSLVIISVRWKIWKIQQNKGIWINFLANFLKSCSCVWKITKKQMIVNFFCNHFFIWSFLTVNDSGLINQTLQR